MAARGAGNDARRESRQPDLNSIKILSAPLPVDNAWEARRAITDKVLDLKIEEADRDWKPEWEAVLRQFNLLHG